MAMDFKVHFNCFEDFCRHFGYMLTIFTLQEAGLDEISYIFFHLVKINM
jgi:hypothetical protein